MISEGKDGGVPVGWFAVEHAAEILIGSTGTAMSPATFQFRATRDVLALTLLLAGITGPADDLSRPQLGLVRDLLADDQQWQAWCRTGLLSASPVMGHADLRLGLVAWEWLGRSRILTGFALSGVPAQPWAATPTAACCVGLAHGRWILDAHLLPRT